MHVANKKNIIIGALALIILIGVGYKIFSPSRESQRQTTAVPLGMVLIPAGTNGGTDPESGTYSLTVSSFYMDPYQVTKAKWDEVYTWAIAHGSQPL